MLVLGCATPNDLPYLNLAVASRAEFLVSWDDDLLDLMQDPSFVARFPRLRIVNPVTFLRSDRVRGNAIPHLNEP